MVLMVDDNISISMSELNCEDYLTPVTQLEDYEYEKGPGDDDPPEYLSDDEDVSNTEDRIPPQDNNRLGEGIFSVLDSYKPLLENHYSRAGYILYVDAKKYAHAKVIILYIYVNYHIIFLQFIFLKRI